MSDIIPFTDPKNRERESLRIMLEHAEELDAIIKETILPAMRKVGHPLTGRVHSLRQEIRLRAMVVGGVL